MPDFAESVKKWGEDCILGIEIRQKRVVKRAFDYCIQYSPVLTGRFRASWRIGIGQTDTSSVPQQPKSMAANPIPPTAAIDAANAALSRYKLGAAMYLTNNVPYAAEIERGSSSKAPRGVLMIAVDRTILDMERGQL